jgi:hypothetical protein
MMVFGFFIIAALVWFVLYALKKEMSLGVQNGGDNIAGLSFGRSVIEGVDVDINKVNETVSLLARVVLEAQTK